MTKKLCFVGLYMLCMQSNSLAQTSKYFNGAGIWTDPNKWSLTSGGTYNQTWANNDLAVFDVANSNISFATTGVTSIIANENVSFTPSGIMSTNGSLLPISVATGKVLNLNGQVLSSNIGTGIIKNGNGMLDLGSPSSGYPGGFVLHQGTVKVASVNALGDGGSLNLDGGVLTPSISANLSFTNKFPGGISFGGNIQFGDHLNVNSGSADMVFTNALSIGSSSRVLTIGGIGNYKFSGNISGLTGAGITINSISSGSMEFSGNNTYTGPTTINAGTLILSGNATLSSSNSVGLGSTATLDITGISASTFTMGLTQPLIITATGSNSSATIHVGSYDSLYIATGGIQFTSFDGGSTPPFVFTGSHGTLALINTPITINTTSVLNIGTYILINNVGDAKVKGTVGSFTITGSGIISSTTANVAVVAGQLILTVAAPNVWTGTTNSNWNTNSNWSLNHVPSSNECIVINSGLVHLNIDYTLPFGSYINLNGGTLIIDTLKTFTLNGYCTIAGLLKINGTVDFSDNPVLVSASATSCGSIDISAGTLLNASNVTIQQWFTAQRAWRMLATPFSSSLTSQKIIMDNNLVSINANGVSDINQYNGLTDSWFVTTAIGANNCYAFFYKGLTTDFIGIPGLNNYLGLGPSVSTYNANGVLNTADVTISPSIATPYFTLVGNPFAAPISSNALTGATSNMPYYYYNATDASSGINIKSGAWIAASANSSTGITIPMMGIIAYQAASTSSFLIPKTAIQTSGVIVSNNLFKTTANNQNLEINLYKNNRVFDRFILRQDDNAIANNIDALDLKKIDNVIANAYIISPNLINLALSTQPDFIQPIKIGISGPIGQYMFRVDDNSFLNSDFILTDNFNNSQQLLHLGAVYTFDITNDSNSYGKNRFIISKQAWATLINENNFGDSNYLLSNIIQDKIKLKITSNNITYTLIDLKGSIVSKGILFQGDQTIEMFNNAAGMYALELSNNKERKIYKILKQ